MRCRLFVVIVGVLFLSATTFVAGQDQGQLPPLPPSPSLTADLAGVYVCDGVNPEGNPYKGIVEVIRTGEVYHLRWTFPQTDDAALGIGIVSNGVLAVSYYGATAGVVVYTVGDGKKMTGKWTVVGGDGVYSETLSKLDGVTIPPAPDAKPDLPPGHPPLRQLRLPASHLEA